MTEGKWNCGDRIVRFERDGRVMVGRMSGDALVELLDERGVPTGRMESLEGMRCLPPCEPRAIWCVGINYLNHAREMESALPPEPCIFLKALTALSGHEAPVRFPAWAGRIDYEGELAVVIGHDCKNVPEADALDVVMGYACFNDVTARELQSADGQWTRGKGFDGFAPLGPCLRLRREMPAEAVLRTRLNGRVVQEAHLGEMIFGVPRIIAHISRFATLRAGDVIATGTPSGVAPVHDGDSVEVEIDGIGVLRNRFVGAGD